MTLRRVRPSCGARARSSASATARVSAALARLTVDVTDGSGNLLFSMRNKLIALMSTFVAEDAGGREVFRVKRNIACE